jgi:hypothetical protein
MVMALIEPALILLEYAHVSTWREVSSRVRQKSRGWDQSPFESIPLLSFDIDRHCRKRGHTVHQSANPRRVGVDLADEPEMYELCMTDPDRIAVGLRIQITVDKAPMRRTQ